MRICFLRLQACFAARHSEATRDTIRRRDEMNTVCDYVCLCAFLHGSRQMRWRHTVSQARLVNIADMWYHSSRAAIRGASPGRSPRTHIPVDPNGELAALVAQRLPAPQLAAINRLASLARRRVLLRAVLSAPRRRDEPSRAEPPANSDKRHKCSVHHLWCWPRWWQPRSLVACLARLSSETRVVVVVE